MSKRLGLLASGATKKMVSKVGDVSLQVAWEIARTYLRTHLPGHDAAISAITAR
jgi:hypothetical protein